jgi:signal transduction histidine kinase
MRLPYSATLQRLWPLACLMLLALQAAGAAAQNEAPAQRPEPRRVLILMGVDPALPGVRQHDDAFRKALQAASPQGVTFFTDTLDMARFDAAAIGPEFLALQRKKYAAQQVDLVVGISEGSLGFLGAHAETLWPGVPLLFSGLDAAQLEPGQRLPGAAYLTWQLDVEGTFSIIESLQPQAERLIVLGGSAAMDHRLSARVEALAQARSRWRVERWSGLPVDELRRRLAALDSRSAIFFTTMQRTPDGRATFPVDELGRLADASRAPMYGLFSTYLGHGIVAGSIVDLAANGRLAAAQATSMLEGRPPAGPLPPVPNRCVADHRQLLIHGLQVDGLPPGCELLNPPRNLWTEYRGFVLAVAAVVTLQALSIAALLMQNRRRRHAEAEALQRRTELSRAMRFAAIGELTASIAHEINQPLGAILSNADAADLLLQSGRATPEALREILSDIRRDDLRAHEVIRRLRALLERHEVVHGPMHLHPALDEVLALLTAEARRRGVAIDHRFDAADDRLHGDAIQLQQVLLNLSLNAMDSMAEVEPARRQLRITTAEQGESLVLEVADRGSGISAADRTRVFESFYTTKPHGLGLGLPIVRAIVEAHEGRIELQPVDGGGSRFTVTLPRRLAAATSAVPALHPPPPAGAQAGASA